ncbi:2-oxoacid:acceptor oxidoreductase family protein [Ramlibacter tataouinensis]|uniref:2-oxoacid:acceptor oxidoreductase family protein n=1 Tax=Ramlibacter tataouinensis TaxID=94132 RepID=UPI0022F3D759|nr:2-oxoacid:acceptor oxidoreductase family protein [Ramlibacter tataouinensis]WBY03206.1 2-oxoacid:acceptor oxidoreductase family protein [Ramlibacter tataouinensis]
MKVEEKAGARTEAAAADGGRSAEAMLEIIVQGRGGQGAQTAGQLLARAFFASGRQVQAFASYGGARRGTPVSSFLRVADRPIRLRCDIERAGAILCFDASLLAPPLLSRADARTLVVVNSARPPSAFAAELPGHRVVPVDALAIARSQGMGRIVNSALIGAFARVLGSPALPVLQQLLLAQSPTKPEENAAACALGWEAAGARLQDVKA